MDVQTTVGAYWIGILRRAFREHPTSFWISAIVLVLAAAIQLYLAGKADLYTLLARLLATFVISSCYFVWQVLRLPTILAQEQEHTFSETLNRSETARLEQMNGYVEEISRLQREIGLLNKKPYAAELANRVRALWYQASPEAKRMVKFLLPLGEVPHELIARSLPDCTSAFSCFRDGNELVLERIDLQPSGRFSFWRVTENFKPVLQDIAYQEPSATEASSG